MLHGSLAAAAELLGSSLHLSGSRCSKQRRPPPLPNRPPTSKRILTQYNTQGGDIQSSAEFKKENRQHCDWEDKTLTVTSCPMENTLQDMRKHMDFVMRHNSAYSTGVSSQSGNLREQDCFNARRAGILGSRLSAEKTTAVSGAGAPFSGMEQRMMAGAGVEWGLLWASVCMRSVHVASSYHAAFLTQLVGMHECCTVYTQIFMENEAFALLTGTY